MRILMFGWEFPPFQSGGLGVACAGIVDGLISNGHYVYLVLPQLCSWAGFNAPKNLQFLNSAQSPLQGWIKTCFIPAGFVSPYTNQQNYLQQQALWKFTPRNYGRDLIGEVYRYAEEAKEYASKTPHEVIHSHDWLTAEAGIAAQKISGKPHVLHIHATEFDRTWNNPNQKIYAIERRGMEKADHIIAVSAYTKRLIVKYYGIDPDKIEVVHNAVKPDFQTYHQAHHLNQTDAVVLFLGRMTIQKWPDYFLQMAQKVLSVKKRVKFVMAGDGDMMHYIIQKALDLGIEKNVIFAGFLKGAEVKRAYALADLYVMPSISEPFGIAPLEAILHGTPVIISRQAGVNEVIKNCLRVDFWDIDEMASKVLAVLAHPALKETLIEQSQKEVKKLSWHKQAQKIEKVYRKVIH